MSRKMFPVVTSEMSHDGLVHSFVSGSDMGPRVGGKNANKVARMEFLRRDKARAARIANIAGYSFKPPRLSYANAMKLERTQEAIMVDRIRAAGRERSRKRQIRDARRAAKAEIKRAAADEKRGARRSAVEARRAAKVDAGRATAHNRYLVMQAAYEKRTRAARSANATKQLEAWAKSVRERR